MPYIETMTDAEKAIAEFLAKGGKVQKLADDESNNVSNAMWYKASQGQVDLDKKLAKGPLKPKTKKAPKPAQEGERFYHDAWKRNY